MNLSCSFCDCCAYLLIEDDEEDITDSVCDKNDVVVNLLLILAGTKAANVSLV